MKKPAVKPFAHQKKSLKHACTTPIVFDTSDPGTGKTGVAIWDFAERRRADGGCALILAPKSLLISTWFNDFKKFAPDMVVSVATAENRTEAFTKEADVYVTNTDAAKWLADQKDKFFKRFDTLIIDESSGYKHHTSARSKAAGKISKHFAYRRLMTGTPNGRSITDVWHQAYLLDGGQRLGSSFYAFRNSVCQPTQVGRNEKAIQWNDKDGAEEAVFGLLSDIVIRHKFEDCVDIPENHRYELTYKLLPKHRKAYDQIAETQMLFIQGQKDPAVLAINAAVVAGKLLQAASGSVYGVVGDAITLDPGRYTMILDLVEARKHSLVFFHWKHQRDALIAEADKRGINFCVLDGNTSDRDREEMIVGYQAGVYQVMFAHPKSAAHGLTLTRGTTTIWASPTPDLEIFEQGSKRQHRMGQTLKTETISILAEGTVDERIYHDILMPKKKRMNNLLDLFATA